MTVEVEFSLPYTLSDTSRLIDVESEYAANKSASSPNLVNSRSVDGHRIVYQGEGSTSDYSQTSRQAFQDAMQTYFNDALLVEFRDV